MKRRDSDEMLSKYVTVGNKVEIQSVIRVKNATDAEKKKVYSSTVHEILSEDRLEVLMPMEKSKLVLLPVDTEFDMFFYTKAGLYECFATVIDRYKSNNIYVLVFELTTNLRKFQRREYYRFSCALEMSSRNLEEKEIESLESGKSYMAPGLPLKRSIIVDISGGGLRFIGDYQYEPDSVISCKYSLIIDGVNKEYNLMGKVLSVKELENRKGVFEHRVQYINIDTEEREEIIRFIFEEERKSRKRERGV